MMQATASISCNQLTGILVDNSMLSYVHRNTIERFGQGIAYYNASNNSRIYCNTFNRTWDGLYFNNAVIGDQGEDPALNPPFGLASDNRWIANQGADRSEGNLDASVHSPTLWYYRNGALYDPQPSVQLEDIGSLFTDNFLPGNPSSDCGLGGGFVGPGPIRRQRYFQRLADGSHQFMNNDVEQRFWDVASAYRLFAIDSQWVTLSSPDDSLYQQFYQQSSLSSTGALVKVEQNILNSDSTSAMLTCNAIMPNCQRESNLQQMYIMAIQKYFSDTVTLTGADSLWLENLACLDPLIEGQAVFAARSLLGIPWGCELNSENRAYTQPEYDILAANNIKVYPNPFDNVLTIEADFEILSISVYDGLGRLYQNIAISGGELSIIQTAGWPSGIYLLKVQGEQIEQQVTIIK